MARKSVKRKPVRKTKSQRMSFDEMHMGPEPGEDYFKENNIGAFFNWYNYMYDRKQVNQVIISYAKKHGYKNSPRFSRMFLPQTLGAIIRGLENGVVFPEHKDFEGEGSSGYQKYIHQELRYWNKKAGELKQEDLDKTQLIKKKRPSVQENINNKGKTLLAEVDYAIDTWDVKEFDMYKYLANEGVSGAVANSIVNANDDLIEEITLAIKGEDPQLKEGYSHMTKGEKNNFLSFLNKLKSDTERYVENHKPVRKKRKAKQYSAEEQIKKLSYLKEDPENRVVSISPTKIVGSNQLWIFNSKTNEIINYTASDRGGLGVKGTTIQNFDKTISASKKLGVKTEHFIDRILEGGSIVLNKVMSEINSKSSKVTGRINNNMILLKVI
tara:strand:- start:238 stop:1386 length:1149 start_codon:yes stop_codon:yes gene_type:complete